MGAADSLLDRLSSKLRACLWCRREVPAGEGIIHPKPGGVAHRGECSAMVWPCLVVGEALMELAKVTVGGGSG